MQLSIPDLRGGNGAVLEAQIAVAQAAHVETRETGTLWEAAVGGPGPVHCAHAGAGGVAVVVWGVVAVAQSALEIVMNQ